MSEETEDTQAFGSKTWVYCDQHMRPHLTGWCTVPVRNKTRLDATEREAAYEECKAKGYELFQWK